MVIFSSKSDSKSADQNPNVGPPNHIANKPVFFLERQYSAGLKVMT